MVTCNQPTCLSAIWNVGTTREDQNDQNSTQGLLVFFGDEYLESSESFNANEDDVASSFNLKNMHQKEVSLIGHNSWYGKDYDHQDPKGIFLIRGHMMAFDLKEAIMDDILRDDHVRLTIFYYFGDISTIMIV